MTITPTVQPDYIFNACRTRAARGGQNLRRADSLLQVTPEPPSTLSKLLKAVQQQNSSDQQRRNDKAHKLARRQFRELPTTALLCFGDGNTVASAVSLRSRRTLHTAIAPPSPIASLF
eukprot:CAMPEP_0198728052 /NCGR_PEP_ID=MMETSP1475-20131203/6698_1 /TAXON_ID= ORGANISM="Unidentified sp., Strain CCMP1999" /NCGR_SAMPLE_ID=MMETSP1475 /ASSEMBLY_ACC=CAM_ASM_001111 /LENGTH=117 /DNA_ID=CAMNT_0044490299 /DNA_START=30 /DNA_END=382 /DNA_ORIENTATION=+